MGQSGFTHPKKLVLDRSEPIFGIILGSTDQVEELSMKFGRCRRNNLKIGEQSVVVELFSNLTEQSMFAFIYKMMN